MLQPLDPPAQPDRTLNWDACYNARDIGGFPLAGGGETRWRAVVRTDNHFFLTVQGQEALRAYGISTIVDLRMPHELEVNPNPFAARQGEPEAPRYLHHTIMDQEDQDARAALDAADSMLAEYIIIIERNKPRIAAAMKAVASGLERGGVVVHCFGGKDRTGIIVALLLSLVGVPRHLIVEDYALSSANLEPIHLNWLEEQARTLGYPVERPRWMGSLPETMQGTLEYIDGSYGSVAAFLMSIGVTEDDMDRIRRHLIADNE